MSADPYIDQSRINEALIKRIIATGGDTVEVRLCVHIHAVELNGPLIHLASSLTVLFGGKETMSACVISRGNKQNDTNHCR